MVWGDTSNLVQTLTIFFARGIFAFVSHNTGLGIAGQLLLYIVFNPSIFGRCFRVAFMCSMNCRSNSLPTIGGILKYQCFIIMKKIGIGITLNTRVDTLLLFYTGRVD